MISTELLAEARLLVDSYGASSPLVRLAQLAAPACRIEPQLLRQLRLTCVPDADVSVEQELWHSELVNTRGKSITFTPIVARVLRDQLRDWRRKEPDLVTRARVVMEKLHADLSPLLGLEDELAWADIFDDSTSIRSGARKLLNSLLAQREGVNHWLGRAWPGLPTELKQLPEGRQLAQVAAVQGASVAEDGDKPAGERVAHLLPLVPLTIRLHGLRLDVNVPPSEATHVFEVPRTQPRAVSVQWLKRNEQLVFDGSEVRGVNVSLGTIVIRTLAGSEYQLEVSNQSTVFSVELLPAGSGTSFIIRFGERRMVVDCGSRGNGKLLAQRLRTDSKEAIELLVLTHTDDDRISGAITVLKDEHVRPSIRDVWFNGSRHLPAAER